MVIILDNIKKIIVSKEEFEKYLFDSDVIVKEGKEISKKLIYDLLVKHYDTIRNNFKANGKSIDVRYSNGKNISSENIEIIKKDFLDILNAVNLNDYKEKNEKIVPKSVDELFLEYNDIFFDCEVDNQKIRVKVSDFLDFLTCDDVKFSRYLRKDKIQDIKTEYFVYIAVAFYKKEKIYERFNIPNNIKDRLINLKCNTSFDIESLNTYLKSEDKETITINKSLIEYMLSFLNDEMTLLEKSIYLYIKLCRTLSYDDEFFAYDQKGYAKEKHQSKKYIESVDKEKKDIVCYEFNYIYARLLKEIGINYKIHKKVEGEEYGSTHEFLSYRVGKYIIEADSTTSILNGDLVNAKINRDLVGLKCKNKNFLSYMDFNDTVNKVYRMVNNNLTTNEKIDTYKSFVGTSKIDFKQKEKVFKKALENTTLRGMDALSFALILRKNIFSDCVDKVSAHIVRNNEVEDISKKAGSTLIVTFNIDDNYSYYLFEEGIGLVNVEENKIAEKFNQGIYEYIPSFESKIPFTQMEKGQNVL